MPAQKIGLYVGKFQPFHNGHLHAVKHILSQVDKLVIAIGSSQYANLENQPFSGQQRQQMITQALADEGIDHVSIVLVPDIHDNERWVEHAQKYIEHFDIVFTNNDLVAELFQEKNFETRPIPMLPGVSGTHIRQKLRDNDRVWLTLVSATTAQIIQSISRVLATTNATRRYDYSAGSNIFQDSRPKHGHGSSGFVTPS